MHGICAVVDWNPSGAAILAVYKYGSQRMHEAARYALPTLRWLGARGALLHGVPNLALQVRLPCVYVVPLGLPRELFWQLERVSRLLQRTWHAVSWLLCTCIMCFWCMHRHDCMCSQAITYACREQSLQS